MASFTEAFDGATFFDGSISFTIVTHDDMAHVANVVTERIASGKKPAQTFVKQLERIELHWKHLQDAVDTLLKSYSNTQVPKKRTSVATMARKAMLSGMSDRVLKLFAAEYLEDMSEYILPDDREVLIAAVLAAMAVQTAEVA